MIKAKFNLKNVAVDVFVNSTREIQERLAVPLFNTVVPTPAEVLSLINHMAALQTHIRAGDKSLIPQRDQSRKDINGMVARQCICVNGIAGGDLAILNESGFELAKVRQPKPIPERVETVVLSNGLNSGDVNIDYSPSKYRNSYIIQMMVMEGEWQTVQTTTKRKATIYNVPEKEFVYFRVGAINASGQGDWSVPVRLLVGK